MIEVFLAIGVVGAIMFFIQKFLLGEEAKRKSRLSDMGVPIKYEWNKERLEEYSDKYYDKMEEGEKKFCKAHSIKDDEELPANWLRKLNQNALHEIKCALMERAITWVDVYTHLDKELKRCAPLYKRSMISEDYWHSVKAVESKIEAEYANIRKDAVLLDPQRGPAMMQEAVSLYQQGGFPPKLPSQHAPESKRAAGAAALTGGAAAGGAGGGRAAAAAAAGDTMPKNLEITDAEYKKIIERATDEKTYEIIQRPEDLDLIVYVPFNTKSKSVKCTFTNSKLQIMINNEMHFTRDLDKEYEIEGYEANWQLISKAKNLHELGDKVELFGLASEENNGLVGIVGKPTPQSKSAGRIAIKIENTDKVLSIKPENLKNFSSFKRTHISVTFDKKTQKKSVWRLPPWDSKKERVVKGGISPSMENKIIARDMWLIQNISNPNIEKKMKDMYPVQGMRRVTEPEEGESDAGGKGEGNTNLSNGSDKEDDAGVAAGIKT